MATKSKAAAQLVQKANTGSSAKNSAPAKVAMAKNEPEKVIVKKNAPSKAPVATAKKAPVKAEAPVKKAVAVKTATAPKAPAKKSSPAAPAAKKAAPPKKTEEPVKAAPPKKAAAPAKKEAPKPAVKAAPPIKKVVVPVKHTIPVKPVTPSPRPMATPVARSADKKPGVVIAHRRMENKTKTVNEPGNTMIQYMPETYRSILDEPQVQQGPAYRYSDEDLVEFREIISSRIDAARKELNYLQGLITRKDEAGTEDTENRYMNMEDGSGAMEREQLAQLASRQIQFMGHLEKALVRIENKTYGICRVTGKLIDKARLRAVPHATLSIDAKKTMSSKN